MISKALSTSKRFAQLFDVVPDLAEFAQSLYPLLVSHTDDFGRQAGDLFTIKHKVHPASPRSPQDFERALKAMHDVRLLVWYQDGKGGEVIQIVQFEKHQTGLHKRTRSDFPKPPGDSGNFRELPTQVPKSSAITEGNRTELNGREEDPEDQVPRADARRTHHDFVSTAEIRSHLRAAAHGHFDAHPHAEDGDVAEAVKAAAAKCRADDYTGREIQKIVDAVRAERARRRA